MNFLPTVTASSSVTLYDVLSDQEKLKKIRFLICWMLNTPRVQNILEVMLRNIFHLAAEGFMNNVFIFRTSNNFSFKNSVIFMKPNQQLCLEGSVFQP